jgi:c-di-GMP-binding flagellar brake protein YcgR
MSEFLSERRRYYRINCELDIRYKFISQCVEIKHTNFFEGKSSNISVGGILIKGIIPELSYLPSLFLNEINVIVYIFLPRSSDAIKAIACVRHLEIIDRSLNLFNIGLEFTEISSESKNILSQFILTKI